MLLICIYIQFCFVFSPGIPTLVFLDTEGHMITRQGRVEVLNDPECRFFPWHPRPVLELSESNAVQLHEGPCLVLFVGQLILLFFLFRSLLTSTQSLLTLVFTSLFQLLCSFIFLSHPAVFNLSFRRWGRGRAGAGQGAHPTNRREDHGQVQSQGGGDATALFCSWRGTFVDICV